VGSIAKNSSKFRENPRNRIPEATMRKGDVFEVNLICKLLKSGH